MKKFSTKLFLGSGLRRSASGQAGLALNIVIGVFIIGLLFTFVWELTRFLLAREQLKTVVQSSALAGEATILSSTQPEVAARVTAQQTALNIFRRNAILGTILNTATLVSSPALLSPGPGQTQLAIEWIDPITQVTGSPTSSVLRLTAAYNYQLFSQHFLNTKAVAYTISVSEIAAMPKVDLVILFDESASMDDQTNVTMVDRIWDYTAPGPGQTAYNIPPTGGGPAQSGPIFGLTCGPNMGSALNGLAPQNLDAATISPPTICPKYWSEIGFPADASHQTRGLRGVTNTGAPPGNSPTAPPPPPPIGGPGTTTTTTGTPTTTTGTSTGASGGGALGTTSAGGASSWNFHGGIDGTSGTGSGGSTFGGGSGTSGTGSTGMWLGGGFGPQGSGSGGTTGGGGGGGGPYGPSLGPFGLYNGPNPATAGPQPYNGNTNLEYWTSNPQSKFGQKKKWPKIDLDLVKVFDRRMPWELEATAQAAAVAYPPSMFTDLVVNLDGNPTFGGFTSSDGFAFPNVGTLVEASRGNLENNAVYYQARVSPAAAPNGVGVNFAPGYQQSYQLSAAQQILPQIVADNSTSTFMNKLLNSTDAHYGFVAFNNRAGTSPTDTFTNWTVSWDYQIAGTTNVPLPNIPLSPAANNLAQIQQWLIPPVVAPSGNLITVDGGTNIADALQKGLDQLTNPAMTRRGSLKAIVLLTDGVPSRDIGDLTAYQDGSDGPAENDALTQANRASAAGIPIYIVALAQDPTLGPEEDAAYSETVAGSVDNTAGHGSKYYRINWVNRASSQATYDATFGNIARQLTSLIR